MIFFRFDFVVNAKPDLSMSNSHQDYGDDYEQIDEFDPLKNRDGKMYKHNLGVFAIKFEGTLMCEPSFVSSEALLVYHKPGTKRREAEIELARLHKESHDSDSYKVISLYNWAYSNY